MRLSSQIIALFFCGLFESTWTDRLVFPFLLYMLRLWREMLVVMLKVEQCVNIQELGFPSLCDLAVGRGAWILEEVKAPTYFIADGKGVACVML
jgi:hypothetical protein